MDLLSKVYGGTSDQEDDNGGIQLQRPILPQPKRAQLENFNNPLLPAQTFVPGRYVSERERAAMASVAKVPESSETASSNSSPVYGGTSDEEDDNGGIQLQRPILPQPKRAKLENLNSPLLPAQTFVPGRYVSKRERAAMPSVAKFPESSTTASSSSSPEDDNGGIQLQRPILPQPKQAKLENFNNPLLPSQTFVPGRYVSKRERAAMASVAKFPEFSTTASSISSPEDDNGGIQLQRPILPQPKRAQLENFNNPLLPAQTFVPGRYVSNRERAAMASVAKVPESSTTASSNSSPVYGGTSDEEDDNGRIQLQRPILPQPKQAKLENFNNPLLLAQTFVPGRYVSKRERAAMASVAKFPESSTTASSSSSPALGSILDSILPHNILSALRDQTKVYGNNIHTPERYSVVLDGHRRSVNAVQWSKSHAHLLASAGMDQTVCIWNVWSRDQKKARVLSCHHAAVKDVKWSPYGLFVLSCGYDCTSRLIDVERGIETQVFNEDQVVGVVKFHPDNYNLFLSGGSKGHLKIWDIRAGKVVHQYVRNLDPVLDAEFTVDAKRIISSSDTSKSNISENSIIVWDVSREIPLSNQVYTEAYTCPSIRCHPSDPKFIAQSNGNYIAVFSTKPPFGLDKYRRYEGHSVSGFPINCNFSLDGEKVISGSSDGYIYVYNSKSCELIRKIKVYDEACVDVVFHPVMSNVVASCSWSGQVSVAVT